MRIGNIVWTVAMISAGYFANNYFSTPGQLQGRFEEKVKLNPKQYEQVVDRAYHFSHDIIALNNGKTKEGYVPFGDLELLSERTNHGSITVIANSKTREILPVHYINEKTAVGTYSQRLDTIKHETLDKSLKLGEDVKKKLENLFEGLESNFSKNKYGG